MYMYNRRWLTLFLSLALFICRDGEALIMTMRRKVSVDRTTSRFGSQSHTNIKGRLGHLRPRLWSRTLAVEEASPTSLKAAVKFKNFEEMLGTFCDSVVVVSFSTSLCGPCKLMKRELSQVSSQFGDEVKMFAVDTDKFPKLGARYQISVLPTVVIFKDGRIHDRVEGLERADTMAERLRSLL